MKKNQIIVFSLEAKMYGIEIINVIDVYEYMQSVYVPNGEEYIEGIINLRGDVVTIINLKNRLHIDKKRDEENVIICEYNKEKFGLSVDDVDGIENIDKTIEAETESGFVKGFVEKNNKEIMILDLKKIITKT